jgi:hypothetical protein
VNRPIKMLSATIVLLMGFGATGVTHAAPNEEKPRATLNSCWGQVTNEFAALGAGTIGEHSRASSPFTPDPGDGGRKGVANQSRFLEEIGVTEVGEPGQGGNGDHALANASGVPGLAEMECDGPPVP